MKHVKEIRQSRRLSQTQLAEMVGCDQSMISKIEKGQANPTLSMIEDIATALHTIPAALFGLPELQQRAVAAMDALSPPKAAAAVTVLEAMARSDD